MDTVQFMMSVQKLGRQVAALYAEGKITDEDYSAFMEQIKAIVNATDDPRH